MSRVPYIDQSGLYAMEDILKELIYEGKKVLISGLNEQPEFMLKRINIIPDVVAEENVFSGIREGLVWVQQYELDNPGISAPEVGQA